MDFISRNVVTGPGDYCLGKENIWAWGDKEQREVEEDRHKNKQAKKKFEGKFLKWSGYGYTSQTLRH